MKLDIIVPHYDEDWEVGRKLFDLLGIQRLVNFHDFRVILIDDGPDKDITPEIEKQDYPYQIIHEAIPHQGVSAARNRGLELSDADWVMFCDFDDTFTSIYSLHCVLDTLGTEKYDLVWWEFWDELADGSGVRLMEGYNKSMLHGKVFRKRTLDELHLRFNTDFHYGEDSTFLSMIEMEIPLERIGHVRSSIVPYVWVYRKNSYTDNPEHAWQNGVDLFHRQIFVGDAWASHGNPDKRDALYSRALCDAFVVLKQADADPAIKDAFLQEVSEFYRANGSFSVSLDILGAALKYAVLENRIRDLTTVKPSDFLEWVQSLNGDPSSPEQKGIQNDAESE